MDPIINEDDDFAAAFAEFTEPKKADAVAVPPVVEAPVTPPVEAVVPPVEIPEAVVPPVDVAATVPDEPPAPNPEYEALRAEFEALKASQPAPTEAPASPAAPIYSADETAAISKYNEDWPDIAKGEALIRRAEYRELVGYIFEQVRQQYAPALDYVNNRAPRDQYSDITALVPDYDDVRDKTLAWVEKQPTYLKDAFHKIAQEGSPEDVADLIGRFKKDTGYAAPAGSVPAPVVAAAPVPAPALPAAVQKAAAKLTLVATERGGQTQAVDDSDFEGAFATYAAAEEKNRKRN